MDYGSIITKETFHNKAVVSTKIEYEESLFSTRESLFKDVIESMRILTDGSSKKMSLEIKVDDKERIRIVKKWQPST